MNEIEKNKIETLDKALEYLMPSTMPQIAHGLFKSQLKSLLSEDQIISSANKLYFNSNCDIYIDFFAKFLYLSDIDCSLITIDNGSISMAYLVNKANTNMPAGSFSGILSSLDNTVWLGIYNLQDNRLRNIFVKWTLSPILMSDNNRDFYIQLLPAITCTHMHELYKILCTYL